MPDIDTMEMPELPLTRVKYQFGNIPVVYEHIGYSEMDMDDYLPSYLAMRPQRGDIIESKSGRQFEVKAVIHVLDNRVAAVRLTVGRPDGGQAPISGGPATSEPTSEL